MEIFFAAGMVRSVGRSIDQRTDVDRIRQLQYSVCDRVIGKNVD